MSDYPTKLMLEFEKEYPHATKYRYAQRSDHYLATYDLAFDEWQEVRELKALNAELARHMQDCIEARNSTVSGISQIIFGILATGIILGKFPLYENLMASIPVFIHILWNICRMTSWYADHINIPFATVEFCLGSCLIYTIHIWPTGGKVMGCLMYLIFMIQIAAIFNCFIKMMNPSIFS